VRIETRALARRFGRVEALRGVDLAIPAGRRVGLVGPNGSGKSTLLRIVMGLLAYDGEARIDGREPRRERAALAHGLAYVPQVPPGLAASAGELVEAVGRLRRLDSGTLRRHAGALGLDLGAVAATPFRALSGGTKQKLLLAIALSCEARLLVLDEPTASLDAGTRERLFRLFDDVSRDTTLLLCSHRLDEMRHLADWVVALDEGRVAYDGPAQDYLRARALSVIEAQSRNGAGGTWLAGLGFHAGSAGWWRKTVAQAEKLDLLPRLAARLDDALTNLHVRDLETVMPETVIAEAGTAPSEQEPPS
jgi:ABC-2 type transport system ATP-binding protein